MKPSVYLETTIPSYLAAWTSRDLVMAARQQVTREWWATRDSFDLFVSKLVLEEVSAGDPDAAARRLELLKDISIIEPSEDADALVRELQDQIPLPPSAAMLVSNRL